MLRKRHIATTCVLKVNVLCGLSPQFTRLLQKFVYMLGIMPPQGRS